MAIMNLSKQDFISKVADYENNADWRFHGQRPVVIDFYADWCNPCRRLMPIVEMLSEEFSGKIDVYKVDVDIEENLADDFSVQTIPTLLFIPLDGAPWRLQGVLPQSQVKDNFERLI